MKKTFEKNNKGRIVSINVSKEKGQKKRQVKEALIDENGIVDDGHSGDWHRQISLLSFESILGVKEKGLDAKPGDFAENLTIEGIDLKNLKIGDTLVIDSEEKISLMVTQIGKQCHKPCNIYYSLGYCIMPEEGIFCRVLAPGKIKVGNDIYIE